MPRPFESCEPFLKKLFHLYHNKYLSAKAYCLWTESLGLSIPNVDVLQTTNHNKIRTENIFLQYHIKKHQAHLQYFHPLSSQGLKNACVGTTQGAPTGKMVGWGAVENEGVGSLGTWPRYI